MVMVQEHQALMVDQVVQAEEQEDLTIMLVRVIHLQQTHLKDLHAEQLQPVPNSVVIDLSFISLDHVWHRLPGWLAPAGWGIALVKPQFEVGQKHLGRNGVVRDAAIRKKAVENSMAQAVEAGFLCSDPMDSPIEGGSGNREFLLHFTWGQRG